MSELPTYPDDKTHFIKEFFEPTKRESRPGYLSDEAAFEIAAEAWQKTMRHPIGIKYRQFQSIKNKR